MKIVLAGIAITSVILSVAPADARRGGFVSGLVRGGVQGAARAGAHSYTAPAIKNYGPDTLTVEQIEKCLKSAQELDKSSEYVDAMADAVNAESVAITQAQQLLSLEKDLVNRYSDASVNAYNAKLATMRTRIAKHNSNVDRAKAEQTGHNTRVSSYNAECAKRYYADDMEAARLRLNIKVE